MTVSRFKKAVFAAIAGSTLLFTAACGSSAADADSSATASTESTSSAQSDASEQAPTDGAYSAGEYAAEGSYQNPGGTSSVKVDLTLEADGTITAVSVEPEASGTSLQYQEKFAGGIEAEVVGKSIDDLDVSKVAGSSLTSGGFNEAIETIKADATA